MDHHFQDSIVSNVGFDDVIDELQFLNFPESDSFEYNDGLVNTSPILDQPIGIDNFAPLYNLSSVSDFSDDNESYPVLNYLNKILMEEQTSVCNDPFALQETEKQLCDVLNNDFHSFPHKPLIQTHQNVYGFDSFDSSSLNFVTGSNFCGPTDPFSVAEPCLPSGEAYNSLGFMSPNPLENSRNCCDVGSSSAISSIFKDSETILQFKKGLEEGNKFLVTKDRFFSDLGNNGPPLTHEKEACSVDEAESSARFNRKKHRDHDNIGRSIKHSALYEEEFELAETFDKILLYREGMSHSDAELLTKGNKKFDNKGSNRSKKGNANAISLDLIELLISCSQSVAANDLKAANEQLKLIKQHASSTGNSYQRLAIPFYKGLEARIEGTGPEVYANLVSKHALSSEELKAFRVFLCAPFKQIFCFFANSMILEAVSKATNLHIIDFGINYGFQWPSLIKHLSNRPFGPPKLRITGIDFPDPGFRPAHRIEGTGRRLAEYCKRFDVPFEYNAIASSKWEEINIENLNLKRNEVLAVNCQWRFRSVLDETEEKGCPRDTVLNLIRDMKPEIFVHDVINAQFGSPFFLTRFKEAIFFFSTVFDILDHNLPRDDMHRTKYEMDYMGMDIINIVSCEGMARIDRPETYKQWQNRYHRAGFKLLPLNKDLMKELKDKFKEGYHKDFIFDDDGYWLMQGWKGKIITASSCLIPA